LKNVHFLTTDVGKLQVKLGKSSVTT